MVGTQENVMKIQAIDLGETGVDRSDIRLDRIMGFVADVNKLHK